MMEGAMGTQLITLREVISIVIKARVAFIVAFLCVALPVAIFAYLLPHQYAASASILINNGQEFLAKEDIGASNSAAPYLTKQEVINSELAILGSRDLAVETINKVGLDKLYPSIAAHPPSNMSPIDAAILKFTKDLKILPITESEVITLTYYNQNRDVAIQTLSTLIDTYQDRHSTIFGDTSAPYLQGQLNNYESQLDNVTQKIAQLREQKSLFDVDEQTNQLIQDRSGAVDVLQSLQAKSADAHGRIQYYQTRMSDLPAMVEAGQTQSDAVDSAKTNLLGLQVQLQQLHQRYTSDVKPVQDVEQQIQTVKDFIAGKGINTSNVWMERNPAFDDANLKLQQSEADAASLDSQIVLEQQDLDELSAQLNGLIEGGRELDALERSHKMLNDLAMTARSRFEDAKSSQDLDQDNIGSVNVISAPSASTKYAKPKHKIFVLIGVALGFFADAVLLVYLAAFRDSLMTPESVERMLNVKVLGAIPYDATMARG